jgi:hypothetical protein
MHLNLLILSMQTMQNSQIKLLLFKFLLHYWTLVFLFDPIEISSTCVQGIVLHNCYLIGVLHKNHKISFF